MIPRDYDDEVPGVRPGAPGSPVRASSQAHGFRSRRSAPARTEALVPYRLPDGRVVRLPSSAAIRETITYRTGGQDVIARRIGARP